MLAAAEGLSNGAIARDLAVCVNTVRKWRGRFADLGPDGLKDADRSDIPVVTTSMTLIEAYHSKLYRPAWRWARFPLGRAPCTASRKRPQS